MHMLHAFRSIRLAAAAASVALACLLPAPAAAQAAPSVYDSATAKVTLANDRATMEVTVLEGRFLSPERELIYRVSLFGFTSSGAFQGGWDFNPSAVNVDGASASVQGYVPIIGYVSDRLFPVSMGLVYLELKWNATGNPVTTTSTGRFPEVGTPQFLNKVTETVRPAAVSGHVSFTATTFAPDGASGTLTVKRATSLTR